MKKKILALGLAAVMAMSMAPVAMAEEAEDFSGIKIGVILKPESNTFWSGMAAGIKEWAAETGAEVDVLFAESEESPGVKGLDLIPGKIKRIPDAEGLKIPQIGWNSLEIAPDKKIFKGIKNGSFVYFVHSYYLECADKADVAATTFYSTEIHASVERNNIFACQFHPEKSGDVGLTILRNFISL